MQLGISGWTVQPAMATPHGFAPLRGRRCMSWAMLHDDYLRFPFDDLVRDCRATVFVVAGQRTSRPVTDKLRVTFTNALARNSHPVKKGSSELKLSRSRLDLPLRLPLAWHSTQLACIHIGRAGAAAIRNHAGRPRTAVALAISGRRGRPRPVCSHQCKSRCL